MDNRITVTIQPTQEATRILVTQGEDEVLKARLYPAWRVHRWAAPTLLEGLSLWFQQPLHVVLSADSEAISSGLQLSDGFGFGARTVHYDVEVVEARRRRRGKRLGGVGDFRELRQLCLRGVR